jgi:hypothetical protein
MTAASALLAARHAIRRSFSGSGSSTGSEGRSVASLASTKPKAQPVMRPNRCDSHETCQPAPSHALSTRRSTAKRRGAACLLVGGQYAPEDRRVEQEHDGADEKVTARPQPFARSATQPSQPRQTRTARSC